MFSDGYLPQGTKGIHMNANFRSFALWVIIGILLIALFQLFQNPTQRVNSQEIPFSQFVAEVESGRVKDVVITGQQVSGSLSDNSSFQTFVPENDTTLVPLLKDNNVTITAKPETEEFSLLSALVSWFPMILILAVWIFFMRQMQGGGKAMGFGQVQSQDADRSSWPRGL